MKIGFVSLPVTGRLNHMTALARKLQSRGDEVRFIGVPDIELTVRADGLTFTMRGPSMMMTDVSESLSLGKSSPASR